MISKNQIRYIKSLHKKKYRLQEKKFLVEGEKSILELLNSDYNIEVLYLSERVVNIYKDKLHNIRYEGVSPEEIQLITTLKTNTDALGVVYQKENTPLTNNHELVLILDDINDPGNLGTIIRVADWYGIQKIIASPATCEMYNPKTIIASMGSFTRVNVYYTDILSYISDVKYPIYGASLDGENIHKISLNPQGFLLIGSESHGIHPRYFPYITHKITIPKYGKAESLNAGVATGIILDNFMKMHDEI